jgi:hypothetical protein
MSLDPVKMGRIAIMYQEFKENPMWYMVYVFIGFFFGLVVGATFGLIAGWSIVRI